MTIHAHTVLLMYSTFVVYTTVLLKKNLAGRMPRLRHHKHVPSITLPYKTLVLETNFTLGNQVAFHHSATTVDCTELDYSGFMPSASIIIPHKTLWLAQTIFISN